MKIALLTLSILIPLTGFAQSTAKPLMPLEKPSERVSMRPHSPSLFGKDRTIFEVPDSPLDFRKKPSTAALLERYVKKGGDVSGGGFGLRIKGSDKVILHDIWCNDHNYVFDETSATSADGRKELALALERVEEWKTFAPALMSEVEKILRDSNRWHLTNQTLQLAIKDHFEFPGTAEELKQFHKTYQESQAAQVNRHTGLISLYAPLWKRMDLKSRAGLLIHESLRLIYIRSVKGYMVPGILQWLTGAIVLRSPGMPLDQRMIESIYEEFVVTLDNTAAADKSRPESWRTELCKKRHEIVREVKASLPQMSFVRKYEEKDALQNLCVLHTDATNLARTYTPWMNLGFKIEDLKSPCQYSSLNEVPTYTLTYWMQKNLGIGLTWTAYQEAQTSFDIVHVLSQHPSSLTAPAYEAVMARFSERGDKYCAQRDDFYGSGEEFLALGDILLETLVKSSSK